MHLITLREGDVTSGLVPNVACQRTLASVEVLDGHEGGFELQSRMKQCDVV